jgi:hypothetical protein
VVDSVPQLIMISMAIGGDGLPCSVSYRILVSGPEGWSLCWLSTLDLLMISTIALHSSQSGHEILLILNSSGVVMLMRFSKSLSLLVGIEASFPKVLISSAL